MKVPNSLHEAQPWVIARLAPDFELLDVWALPAQGSRDDFTAFLEMMVSLDPARVESAPTRALFTVRLAVGRWLGWDDHTRRRPIPGCAETSLADRLPEDLRGSADSLEVGEGIQRVAGGFVPLYRTDDEWAAELSNATVHGVLHLTWVEQDAGRYRAHLAVYVKPRGKLGWAYMRLIDPFRHLVVYPALLRRIGRAWAARRTAPSATSS